MSMRSIDDQLFVEQEAERKTKMKQKFKVANRYKYTYNDGGTVKFTVKEITDRNVWITFDNGCNNHFSLGSPMAEGSVLV
jgi:hypothetical protein